MPHVESRRVPNLLNEYLVYYFLQYGQPFIVGGSYAVCIVEGDETDELRVFDTTGGPRDLKMLSDKSAISCAKTLTAIVAMKEPEYRLMKCPACGNLVDMKIGTDKSGQWYTYCPRCKMETPHAETPREAMDKSKEAIETANKYAEMGVDGIEE